MQIAALFGKVYSGIQIRECGYSSGIGNIFVSILRILPRLLLGIPKEIPGRSLGKTRNIETKILPIPKE